MLVPELNMRRLRLDYNEIVQTDRMHCVDHIIYFTVNKSTMYFLNKKKEGKLL